MQKRRREKMGTLVQTEQHVQPVTFPGVRARHKNQSHRMTASLGEKTVSATCRRRKNNESFQALFETCPDVFSLAWMGREQPALLDILTFFRNKGKKKKRKQKRKNKQIKNRKERVEKKSLKVGIVLEWNDIDEIGGNAIER